MSAAGIDVGHIVDRYETGAVQAHGVLRQSVTSLPIDEIVVVDRHRKDLGDLDQLAESIRRVGLLQPVVVVPNTPGFRLVAGQRRLEAVRRLGWLEVRVVVATSLADTLALVRAEQAENVCRKDFTPSEAVAIGRTLEDLERPKASARMRADGESTGPLRDIVAPAVGMKPSRYAHAKTVVTAAESDLDPDVREIAQEAVKEMDESGYVESAYRKVAAARRKTEPAQPEPSTDPRVQRKNDRRFEAKRLHAQGMSTDAIADALGVSESTILIDLAELGVRRITRSVDAIREREERIPEMASDGHTSRQIADALGVSEQTVKKQAARLGVDIPADRSVAGTHRIDSIRVVEQTVVSAENITAGTELVDYGDLDAGELDRWVSSLDRAIKSLQTFKRQLIKELTQ